MKDGFIKAAAITPKIKTADCGFNANSIVSELKNAAADKVKLALFPELAITGASCGDLFRQPLLLERAYKALDEIKYFTANAKHEIITVVGAPVEAEYKLFNACVVIYKGRYLGAFILNRQAEYFHYRNKNEIIHTLFGPMGTDIVFYADEMPEFSFSVSDSRIILNPYAEGETVVSAERRVNRAVESSFAENRAYICAGAGYGESTTDMVYSGHCLIVENGIILSESKPFKYKSAVSEIDVKSLMQKKSFNLNDENAVSFQMDLNGETKLTRTVSKTPFVPDDKAELNKRCEIALQIQANALKKRLEHINAKKMIVGLSGGLDSTTALIAAVNAADITENIERGDILAVTMPCFGTSKRTKSNAEKLAEALGVDFKEIDITKSVLIHFADIGHDPDKYDAVFENAQARERTQVLMDIANSVNGLVIGTGDLSELALGWATYNGDHMSMYGINAGMPKTFMREVVRYVGGNTENKKLSDVLNDILDTPVSPELLPLKDGENENSQITEDLIGPYELHDFFIYYATKCCFPPRKVFRMAEYAFKDNYNSETILKWLKNFYFRFFSQQFKRSCMPDGVMIGSVSFSPRTGLKMPSDAVSGMWLDELENIL